MGGCAGGYESEGGALSVIATLNGALVYDTIVV